MLLLHPDGLLGAQSRELSYIHSDLLSQAVNFLVALLLKLLFGLGDFPLILQTVASIDGPVTLGCLVEYLLAHLVIEVLLHLLLHAVFGFLNLQLHFPLLLRQLLVKFSLIFGAELALGLISHHYIVDDFILDFLIQLLLCLLLKLALQLGEQFILLFDAELLPGLCTHLLLQLLLLAQVHLLQLCLLIHELDSMLLLELKQSKLVLLTLLLQFTVEDVRNVVCLLLNFLVALLVVVTNERLALHHFILGHLLPHLLVELQLELRVNLKV